MLFALAGSWRFWAGTALAAGIVGGAVMLGALLGAGTDRAYYNMNGDRVLTLNRDAVDPGAIDYDNFPSSGTKSSTTTRYWWELANTVSVSLYNLQRGNEFYIHAPGADGEILWRLYNCRAGNTNPTTTSGTLPASQNALPISSTAKSFKNRALTANQTTAGVIVMQNTPAAQIVSSCYSNGIGTIYFDAVNGFTGYRYGRLAAEAAYAVWKTNELGVVADEAFRAKMKAGTAFNDLSWTNYLEFVETEDGEFRPVPPDGRHGGLDEIHVEITFNKDDNITTTNITHNVYGRCAWVPLKLSGAWWSDNTSSVKTGTIDGEPEELKLQMPMDGDVGTNMDRGGGKFTNFYRVWAPVQSHEGLKAFCRGPMRFRIRRLDTPNLDDPERWLALDDLDGTTLKASQRQHNALILVDNVIASYPAMGASLLSDGEYDTSHKLVRNQVGWAGSLSSRYPARGETNLTARAKVIPLLNDPPGLDTSDFPSWVPNATMKWRWRYLDQIIHGWTDLPLELNDEQTELVSKDPLDLPDMVGDVEFHYAMELNAPYYGFVDYTGNGDDHHPLKQFGYSERLLSAESRFDPARLGKGGYPRALPSCGTDYFTRLREGRSDQLAYILKVRGPDGRETDAEFWVTEDKRWCTCFALPTNAVAGAYRFRIAGLNPEGCWTGESADPAVQPRVTEIPWSGKRLTPVKDEDLESLTKGWTTLDVTADSGYLMFQIFEDTPEAGQMTYTIVRAEYQNFNSWNDAAKGMFDGRGLFVGSSEEDGKRSGVSPAMRAVECSFDDWPVTPVSGRYWGGEDFSAVKLDTPGYESYKKITTPKTTPGDGWGSGGWTVGNAMWVPAKFSDALAGAALQMFGQGEGYMQYVSATAYPRGIGEVSFRARLGQYISFNDFCYRYQNSVTGESPYLKNYTYYQPVIMGEKDDFEGLATVSLVACYQPGAGCYEFRVERIDPNLNEANKALRLSLYKWSKSGTGVKSELLGAATNSVSFNTTRLVKYVKNSIVYTGNMFITVTEEDGGTRVFAGLNSAETSFNKNRNPPGSSYTEDKYRIVSYLDKTKPLTSGSYGFLSKDCPAQFTYGCHFLKPATFTEPGSSYIKKKGNFTYYTADSTVRFHCGDAFYRDDFRATDAASKASHTADWTLVDGRYEVNEKTFDLANTPGIRALASEQKVSVTVVPKGSTAWDGPDARVIATNIVSSFGMSFTNSCPYSLEDASIRIASAGTEDDLRTDIVIDDVKVTQWRGDDFDNTTDNPQFKDGTDEGCPNAVVFTAGRVFDWLVTTNRPSPGVETITTNRAVELAAMRVDTNAAPASIRSPLFDGKEGRGCGLGSVAFEYADADTNHLRLVVQICTNDLTLTRWRTRTKAIEGWDEFLTIDFTNLPPSGVQSVYLGLHEIPGAMRVIVHPDVVRDARNPAKNPKNDPKYGSVAITRVVFRDEPKVDISCWWGWNIRTTSESLRQYLFDHSADALSFGMSAGLNNSVHMPEAELRTDVDEKEYKKHMPFVQTPTFTNGRKIGEVAFNARLYDTNTTSSAPPVPAAIAIYGAVRGDVTEDSEWEPLTNIVVELRTFERFHYKAPVGKDYAAFRFAVTGVDGVEYPGPKPPTPLGEPVRVLLDEVVVSEAVYPRVGFSNVRPFRKNLEHLDYIEDILSVDEQPMCNESWSVQAEIEPTMLPDEIDMTKGFRVFLYWYEGTDAWGFDGWRKTAEAKGHVIELVEIPDRPRTFRGAYDRGAATIVTPEIRTAETVQYMLEVEYTLKNGEVTRDPLEQIDWRKPEWYGETDFNAGKKHFSAYTILDAVPFGGYAGINEVNIYGGLTTDGWYNNVDRGEQYVEVRVPAGADLTDWHLDFVTRGNSDDVLVTNSVAMFGRDAQLPPSKTRNANQNYAFIVAASPQSKDMKDPLEPTKSAVDGVWFVTNPTATLDASGEIAYDEPIAIRLVRPSGIIEHQVVAQGTNTWYEWTEKLGWEHSAERLRDELSEGGNQVFLAGQDMESTPVRSLGVFKGLGTNDVEWTAALRKTPGRINEGQVLDPDYPTPIGDTIIVYAQISGDHILQTFGDKVKTNELVMAVVRKGETTNITYHLDTWYETGEITLETNGVVYARGTSGRRPTYELSVGGAGISNNVTVTASARPWSDLATRYGLTEGNPYTPAALAWLNAKTCGKTPKAFANDDGEIRLAKLYNLSGQPYRPDDPYLSLTDMYWLDMDPTVGGLILQTGFSSSPTTKHVTRPLSGGTTMDCEDMIAKVKMRIYRENDDGSVDGSFEPYAPYTLNGLEPGSTSRTMTGRSWDAETFKITAHLNNGQDAEKDPDKVWMPVRYFHFDDNSFDENCEAEIQVVDPYYQFSDWYPWKLKGIPPPWYRFYLDARRFGAISSELLTPDSTFDE